MKASLKGDDAHTAQSPPALRELGITGESRISALMIAMPWIAERIQPKLNAEPAGAIAQQNHIKVKAEEAIVTIKSLKSRSDLEVTS